MAAVGLIFLSPVGFLAKGFGVWGPSVKKDGNWKYSISALVSDLSKNRGPFDRRFSTA